MCTEEECVPPNWRAFLDDVMSQSKLTSSQIGTQIEDDWIPNMSVIKISPEPFSTEMLDASNSRRFSTWTRVAGDTVWEVEALGPNDSEEKIVNYSGDLNTGIVWYLIGQK